MNIFLDLAYLALCESRDADARGEHDNADYLQTLSDRLYVEAFTELHE